MTKAAMLDLLKRVPMNAEIMFVEPSGGSHHGWDKEHELTAAFTVTGPKGLVVLFTDGRTPKDYEDVEGLR